jgi:hypothetical protein
VRSRENRFESGDLRICEDSGEACESKKTRRAWKDVSEKGESSPGIGTVYISIAFTVKLLSRYIILLCVLARGSGGFRLLDRPELILSNPSVGTRIVYELFAHDRAILL